MSNEGVEEAKAAILDAIKKAVKRYPPASSREVLHLVMAYVILDQGKLPGYVPQVEK